MGADGRAAPAPPLTVRRTGGNPAQPRSGGGCERDTDERERTDEAARRGVIARLAIISLGTLVTVAGLAMLVLPGPGIVVVIAGLGILATEVSWAERLLAFAKRKANVDKVTAQAPWLKPAATSSP